MGSDDIDFSILLVSVPLVSIPYNYAHVVTTRNQEEGILGKAGYWVHVTVHLTPSLSSFEFIDLNLIKVTSNDKIAIFGFIFILEIMDAEDFITLLDS
jgi:hypothetical protein